MVDQALEQIGWEWRWFDLHPDTVTTGQWSQWERVKPRSRLQTEDEAVRELRSYIANGLSYQIRPIYAGPADGYGVAPAPAPQRWAVFCRNCRKEWTVDYEHPGGDVCAECAASGVKEGEQCR